MRRERILLRDLAAAGLVVVLSIAVPRIAAAQNESVVKTRGSKRVVPGEQYGHPVGGTFLFGSDYRDLWTATIDVPVLDLGETAGGLTPTRTIGGNESRGLAFRGKDGRDYSFRPVKKDVRGILPEAFKGSIVADIVQDQIAATIPGAEVVKAPLARAVGVHSAGDATMVVLPDDSALGEYRQEFAGALGVFLEFPQPKSPTNPGFLDATEILGSNAFWQHRFASVDALPDTEQFLRSRILDLFLNDWDRHLGQWRWARVPGQPRLQPVPEDADMAMSDYRGVGLSAARFMNAPFVTFDGQYSPLPSVAKNGWDVDRFLLTNIERATWMRIVRDVQARLTDAAIDAAIDRLPAEFKQRRGEQLTEILKQRREHLAAYGERFYELLAKDVDVHGTDGRDRAVARWLPGGDLEVTVARIGDVEPYYRRHFVAAETDEVRIYLHGGDDEFALQGRRASSMRLRLIGGPGDDVFDVESGDGVSAYDEAGNNRVTGARIALDARVYREPARPAPNNLARVPNPDWGRVTTPEIAFSYSADPGLMIGAGFDSQARSFRAYPWRRRHTLKAAWAFSAAKPFVDYTEAFHPAASVFTYSLNVRHSGIEQLRYFGLGNETPNDRRGSRLSSTQTEIYPSVGIGTASGHAQVGLFYQRADSSGSNSDSILALTRPLGSEVFSQFGVRTDLGWSSRSPDDVLASGVTLSGTVKHFFETLDAAKSFGSVQGRVDAYVPTGTRYVWNLQAGGKTTSGDVPFFERAYIGHRTVPGYAWNRFSGDSALYGGVDLYVITGGVPDAQPAGLGFDVFADAGRVFLDGESSSEWHPSAGAGVFYMPFQRAVLAGVKLGKSQDGFFVTFGVRIAKFGF